MFRPDIPFTRDDANRFLPWMVALMCGLAALMLLIGLSLNRWITEQHGGLGGHLTIQIPDHGSHQQALVKQASEIVQKASGVQSVRVLAEAEVGRLISPWIGSTAILEDLPLPTVVEVALALDPNGGVDYDYLTTQLHALSPDISLDNRAIWVEKFSSFSRVTQAVIYALTLAILASLAGMMVFASRASMKLHAHTVQLLHALGAGDDYISRQFQRNALRLALSGAVPGALGAGILYLLISTYAAQMNAPLLPRFAFSMVHMAMLALLPMVCAVLSMVSVRISTQTQLRKLP